MAPAKSNKLPNESLLNVLHTATSTHPNTAVHAAQHEPVLSPAQEDINSGLNAPVSVILALTSNAVN